MSVNMSTKKVVGSSELSEMAEQLEQFAARYRELAKMIESHTVGVTGMATFSRIIKHLGSNTRRIRVQIQKVIDEKGVDDS